MPSSLPLADLSLLKTKAFFGGKWIGSQETFGVTNPSSGALLGHVPDLSASQVEEAIDAASTALGPWSALTAKERGGALRRWYDLIVAHCEDLAIVLTSEQGKPLAEAKGEIMYGASFVEFYAEEAKRVYGETIPSPWANRRILVEKEPVGVVCAITPWNFPCAMITRKVAPALAAGCTVVLKPAPDTPLTALFLAALAERAGFPPGVFNVVTGEAARLGAVLTASPRVRALTFTGSTMVGKRLMEQCAQTVKKVSLELGGNAPFVIFEDADIPSAIGGVMASKFRNAGQTCVCANRIFVHSSIYKAFAQGLEERICGLTLGDGMDPKTTLGPLIHRTACEKVLAHVEDAKAKGARVVMGGKIMEGSFFAPTLLTGATQDMRVFKEETFGPVAPLFSFETEEEAVALANATPAGLAAYFYTRDMGRVLRVSKALRYGIVGVNEGIISTEVAPFGGVKESGIGREGSHHGMDEFLDLKYILINADA